MVTQPPGGCLHALSSPSCGSAASHGLCMSIENGGRWGWGHGTQHCHGFGDHSAEIVEQKHPNWIQMTSKGGNPFGLSGTWPGQLWGESQVGVCPLAMERCGGTGVIGGMGVGALGGAVGAVGALGGDVGALGAQALPSGDEASVAFLMGEGIGGTAVEGATGDVGAQLHRGLRLPSGLPADLLQGNRGLVTLPWGIASIPPPATPLLVPDAGP